MNKTRTLGSGNRKYTPIWKQLKEKTECRIKCPVEDVYTIIRAVAKEKNRDKNRPQHKVIKHSIKQTQKNGEVEIYFSLVTEVTINNL